MRFRKRIKIAKGITLNLSKSGVSATLGTKGLSANIGSKGTYLNYGIPGTGLYDRKKILGSGNKTSDNSNKKIVNAKFSYKLSLLDDGTLIILDGNGREFDESTLRKIKKDEEFKLESKALILNKCEEINNQSLALTLISTYTPKLFGTKEFEALKAKIIDVDIEKEEFNETLISRKKIRDRIHDEIRKEHKITIFNFFKFKEINQRFKEALDIETEKIYLEEEKKYNARKELFYENEKEKQRRIERQKSEQLNMMNSRQEESSERLSSSIENILKDIELPLDFSCDYEIVEDSVNLDLDLPEIEDFHTKKATILKSGKLSIKEKSQKELREEYLKTILGLGYFLGGNIFNSSLKIKNVKISGYTQRLSKKTGHIEDDYVYSVNLTRESFRKINFEKACPIEAIENFEHRIDKSTTYLLKVIEPL